MHLREKLKFCWSITYFSFEKVVFRQGPVNDRKLVVGNLDAFYADFFVLLPGNGKSFVRAP